MSFEVLNNKYLAFTLTNNFNVKANREVGRGIGNENAKRRLNLLFSDNFILDSKVEGDIYKLFLKIPVS